MDSKKIRGVRLRRIVAIKVYFDRARGYIGYIQTFMIVILLVNSLEWEVNLLEYALLFVLFFVISIFVGWLDTKLNIRKYEYENQSEQNKYATETLDIVKQINDKL